MKIHKMKCCELPMSKHTEGKQSVFGRPMREVPQYPPTPGNLVREHHQMAGIAKAKA